MYRCKPSLFLLHDKALLGLVLVLVDMALTSGRKVTKLHADHLVLDLEGNVVASVVDLEPQAHETRQDGTRPGVCADRLSLLTRLLERQRNNVRCCC